MPGEESEGLKVEGDMFCPVISTRRVDLYDMFDILLGKFLAKVFLAVYAFQQILGLTGYYAIFAASLAISIPFGEAGTCNIYEDSSFEGSCRWQYIFFVCIGLVVLGFITLMGLTE